MNACHIPRIPTPLRYFQFIESPIDRGYGLGFFTPDGQMKHVVHDWGNFNFVSREVFHYAGDGSWGTVFPATAGKYNVGGKGKSGDTFRKGINNPTEEDLAQWSPDRDVNEKPGA